MALVNLLGGLATEAKLEAVRALLAGTLKTQPDGVADGASTLGWQAGTAINTAGYSTVLLAVTVLTGAPVIAVFGSISGVTQHQLDISSEGPGTPSSSTITAAGMYSVSANGLLSYSINGGTATVNAMLKRAD